MTRAVLDTNVLVSAMIVNYGKPAQLVGYASEGKFILVISDEIIQETKTTLHRKHIKKRFHPTDTKINEFLDRLYSIGEFVELKEIENLVPQDPPDNLILATAVQGNAAYLVSGNLHLLNLVSHRNIRIVTPAQFLNILGSL